MSDYFDELIGVTGNQYASKVSDGMLGSVNEYIDTGSYILNALISGSIHKGLPSNKITAIAGESSTGKTFFTIAEEGDSALESGETQLVTSGANAGKMLIP